MYGRRSPARGAKAVSVLSRTLAQVEAAHIRAVLERVDGNRTRAAKILGISSATLWRKLKQEEAAPAR